MVVVMKLLIWNDIIGNFGLNKKVICWPKKVINICRKLIIMTKSITITINGSKCE